MFPADSYSVADMGDFGARLAEALRLARKDRKDLAAHLGVSVLAFDGLARLSYPLSQLAEHAVRPFSKVVPLWSGSQSRGCVA